MKSIIVLKSRTCFLTIMIILWFCSHALSQHSYKSILCKAFNRCSVEKTIEPHLINRIEYCAVLKMGRQNFSTIANTFLVKNEIGPKNPRNHLTVGYGYKPLIILTKNYKCVSHGRLRRRQLSMNCKERECNLRLTEIILSNPLDQVVCSLVR